MKTFSKAFFPLACGVLMSFSACKEEAQVLPANHQSGNELIAPANVSPEVNAVAASYTLANWMGSLNSNLMLSRISIPGTHDSGARYEPISGTAKCQNLTIGEQLATGIRFLDIRCRHIDNAFTIHHGAVYQNLNFTDVLNACFSFLSNNPSETIIMSIKEEHTSQNVSRSFEATLDSYLQQNPDKWYLGESVPALGQVRGKIVLLRRFGASSTPKGINATAWQDNTTFEIHTAQAQLKIQDQYKVSNNDAKWNAMVSLFNEAKAANSNRLYINFASGYRPGLFGIPSIPTVSNDINPRVTSFFTPQQSGYFGIIPMDFAVASRNELIIRTNFPVQ